MRSRTREWEKGYLWVRKGRERVRLLFYMFEFILVILPKHNICKRSFNIFFFNKKNQLFAILNPNFGSSKNNFLKILQIGQILSLKEHLTFPIFLTPLYMISYKITILTLHIKNLYNNWDVFFHKTNRCIFFKYVFSVLDIKLLKFFISCWLIQMF